MTGTRVIENPRVIAGIFRECILSRIDIRLDQQLLAKVVSIEESDRRSSDEKRRITLAIDRSAESLTESVTMELQFSAFVISCVAQVEIRDKVRMVVLMPGKMQVSDLRESRRIEPRYNQIPRTTVLLVNNGQHQEVPFQLLNISRYGLAGLVEIDARESITTGALVLGTVHAPDGSIDLSGRIVAVSEGECSADLKIITIRIVRNERGAGGRREGVEGEGGAGSESALERRQEPRYPMRFDLVVRSILVPHQIVEIEVIDASVTGFSGRCKTPFMMSFLIPGVPLRVEDSSLIADVVDEADGMVRCYWTAGSDEDRSAWLKRLSPAIAESVSLTMPEASQLLEIFCGAGAFSSEFLRSQRKHFDSMVRSIEDESSRSAYVHRWIDRRHNDEAIGHISCIRMGDNAWFATDLVKAAGSDVALSENFVRKFLHSFSHHALSLAPVPRMLLIWVKGHPYWEEFHQKILRFSPPDCFSTAIGYVRTPHLARVPSDGSIRVEEINRRDYRIVSEASARIGDRDVLELARAFDFDIDRFGSPRLSRSIANDRKVFWRRYFRVEAASFSGLAVLTALPDGMNPNRIIDSAWFFENQDAPVRSEAQWLDVTMKLKEVAAVHGQSLAGIRRVSARSTFSMFKSEHAEMLGFLMHPSALLSFG